MTSASMGGGRRAVIGRSERVSWLERLARKIEPTPEERAKYLDNGPADNSKLPLYSRAARRIIGLQTIAPDFFNRGGFPKEAHPPKRTKVALRMLDRTPMVYYSDGSLRHALPHVRMTRQLRRATKKVRARLLAKTQLENMVVER